MWIGIGIGIVGVIAVLDLGFTVFQGVGLQRHADLNTSWLRQHNKRITDLENTNTRIERSNGHASPLRTGTPR